MKNQVTSVYNPQSGSIFVWIFVMIALFGALSYAMTRSTRTGVNTVTGDKARLAASEVIDFANAMRSGVKTVRIDGVPLYQISFEAQHSIHLDGSANIASNNYCSTDKCKVYSLNGGGIKEQEFSKYSVTPTFWGTGWIHPGYMEFELADVKNIGSAKSDLIMKVSRLNKDVCAEVNKHAGLEAKIYGEDQTGNLGTLFVNDTQAALALTNTNVYGYSEPALAGHTFFCVGNPPDPQDGGDGIFVLEAR